MRIHHNDSAKKVESRTCQAWVVNVDGKMILSLFASELNFKDIHHILSTRYPQFKVQRVDVGEFVVEKCLSMYSGDARWVNEQGFFTEI